MFCPPAAERVDMNYRCITQLDELASYMEGAGIVAFDFETSPMEQYRAEERAALDAHKSQIAGISLSMSEGTAVYVPLTHQTGKNADAPQDILQYLRHALFESPRIVKVAHNLAFEAMFLYAQGIVVQAPCYDTIAAAQLTLKNKEEFRGLSDSGLKLLATSLFQADMPDFQTVTKGRHFDEMDPGSEEAIRYACADADYTLRLYHRLNTWFDRFLPSHRNLVEQVESPTAVYCGIMKYNGVPMDRELMLIKQREAEEKITALRTDLDGMTGGVDLGANAATDAFKKYLYQDLGLPVLKTTEKFQEAADDQALILLHDWCKENRPRLLPMFGLIQEYRKWSKLKSTYIDGYLACINSATGRIHPDLMPLATQTGRFACRKPNLQNQVSSGIDPIGVRNFIVAPEGWVLLEADYSQVELRIAAYLSGDRTMLDAYRNGADIHAITTSAIFGISLEEASDKRHVDYKHRRTVAKGAMFGILYGIYAKGLMRNLKATANICLSEDECAHYIKGIKARYPGLAAWQDTVIARAKTCMYAQTALGRRRYLPGIRSQNYGKRGMSERMAINTPVQGLAADCLKLSMARLVVALADQPYIRPLMTVHDSLVFEARADKAEEAGQIIRECMEALPPLEGFAPLVADLAAGERYGELK